MLHVEHSAILLTFIRLPFVIKIFVVSILEWSFYTCFTVIFFSAELQQRPYWSRYGRTRLLIYTVINSKYFDLAIAGVIGLNVVTMAMEYYMMPVVSLY